MDLGLDLTIGLDRAGDGALALRGAGLALAAARLGVGCGVACRLAAVRTGGVAWERLGVSDLVWGVRA